MKHILLFLLLLQGVSHFSQSDGCSAATPLSVTANCSSPTSGTTTGATQTISGCVGTADDDVWYSFVATGTTHDITVDGAAGFDAVVQLFSGACSGLISLGCQDGTFDGGVETIYASGLTPGATYRIRVYHYYAGSGSGSFTICVTPGTPPPSNDACNNAIGLTVNTSCSYTSGTSQGATQSLTGCAGNADDDVWFSFVATNSVQTITVDPSANMDPVIQLYSGSCGSLGSLYCEDSGFTDDNEQIDAVGLVPGQTYFVRVYDYYTSTGGDPFQICVSGAATSAPSNDEPCNAIALPPVTAACNYLNFTTIGATTTGTPGAPSSCVGGGGAAIGGYQAGTADVWFSVQAPASGSLYITPEPGYGISDGVMVLYSGTCGSLTQEICSDDNDYPGAANDFLPYIAATGLTPNQTYFIRYFGFGTSQGNFGLCVQAPTNDDCANALYICDLNGYSASTSAAYTPDRPGTGAGQMYGNNETPAGVNQVDGTNTGGPFGGTTYDVNIDNNSWITFTAAATTATLYVSIYDCWVGNFPSGGVQMEIFSGTNCDNFVSVSNFEESSTGFTITATGLTIGQDYYLMVDGYAGDICNYTITAESGVAFPEITSTANPICSGSSTTLSAPSTASSYLWYPGGETTPDITVSPSATTTYYCVVEGVCGYKQTLSHTITVNQPPTLTTNTSQSVCSGTALGVALNSDISSNYSWFATSNGSVGGETTSPTSSSTINNTLTNTTGVPQVVNYTINSTAISSGCPNSESLSVTVNPVPSMTSGNSDAICSGQTLNFGLSSDISSTFTWVAASNGSVGGESTTNQTGATIINTLTNTTTSAQTVNYSVYPTATTGGCQGSSQSVAVNVNPRPTMTSTNSTAICSGLSPNISLTSNIGSSYEWSATSNGSVTGESTGTQTTAIINDVLTNTSGSSTTVVYSVTPTSTVGTCAGTAQMVNVTVNPVPNMTSGNSDAICSGETLSFGLTSDISSTFTWVAASNGSVTGESTTNQTGATINNTLTNTTTSAQTVNYSVYPTATSGSCQGSTQGIAITVNPNPNANAGATATIDCNNSSVILSGSSTTTGVSYSWTGPGIVSGGSTATPTVNVTGIYILTVQNTTTLCESTSTVTVNSDLSAPTATASGSASTVDCNNPSVTLDGTGSSTGGNITYGWTTSGGNITGGTSGISTSADQGGTYTLTVTNTTNGCDATDDVILGFNQTLPNVEAGTNPTLTCASPTLDLSGSSTTPGATYSWSGPSITAGGSTATPTINGTGIYTLEVTDPANGCIDTDQVEVFADANTPNASIGATSNLNCSTTTTVIAGSSTTLGVNFSWTGPSITANGTTDTPTVDAPGLYTLTVTDPNNGCTNTANITITEDITLPTISVVPSATAVDCNNPIITLDGTGSSSGANFDIVWSTADGNITGATNTLSTTADEEGTYTLTITNTDNNCSDFTDITLAIDTASPIAAAGTDVNFPCGVSTVALDGSASTGTGITYQWTGPGTITNGTSATPDVDATGIFTLTVTGTNGCTDSDVVEVVPDSNAPVAAAGTDLTVTCSQNLLPVTLDGTGSAAGGNITYSWSTTGTGNITGGNTSTPSVDQAGSYTILVTNTTNNCTASATVNVTTDTISPTADLSATVSSIITCNTNNQAVLNGANSIGSNLTYSFTTLDGNVVSQSGTSATVDAGGTYEMTVTGDNSCTDVTTIVVTMDTVTPTISINTPDTLNCNVTNALVNASGTSSVNGTYAWTTTDGVILAGANTSLLNAGAAGTYTLTVTNDNGCSSSSDVIVLTAPAPVASFTPTPTTGFIPLDVTITNNSTGDNLTYAWDFGDGNTSTVFEPANTYGDMGTYDIELIVIDEHGCSDTTSVTIDASGEYSIIIPNIFSPNGDDDNDIYHFTLQNATDLHCLIYNRWGQLMYEFEAIEGGWDGRTYSGLEASEGGYYYLLWVTDFSGEVHEYTGPFELVR